MIRQLTTHRGGGGGGGVNCVFDYMNELPSQSLPKF